MQKTPRHGREVYEMWKTRAPARTAMCSQECKVQGMPQNRTLPHKVCQSKKRGRRANLVQTQPQSEQDTHIDENGVRQPNPPMVNMLKIVNHIGATKGSQEKHLKFPIDVDPRGPYKHHLVVRVDTGADVNCMNEKTVRRLFPKVKLSVFPHDIQNFGNSAADISILGQLCTYLQFRGEKYLNILLSPMPTTVPIYSAMEQPSEWVYYFLTTQRRMW